MGTYRARIWLLTMLVLLAMAGGCGDSSDTVTVTPGPNASPTPTAPSPLPSGQASPGGQPSPGASVGPGASPTPTPVASPGTVTVNFVLETLQRVVPAYVQTYRARGVDAQGRTVYGPFERPRTAQLVLSEVPLNVREIQIDLVIGSTVTGLVRLPVDLVANPNPVFNDPNFVDVSTLTSLAVSPANLALARASRSQLAARGTFSDGQSYDLTQSVRWVSSNAAVANVSFTGEVQGQAVGNATVTASSSGQSGSVNVTVNGATLVSLAVLPGNATLTRGGTQAFTARGTYSDNTTQDLTTQVSWSSSAATVASISGSGLATAIGGGTSTVTARLGSISGSAGLTVSGAALLRLEVVPTSFTLNVFQTRQLQALGRYEDGSSQDLTTMVAWSNSEPLRAAVGPTGLVTALFAGPCSITARLGALSGEASCTVTDNAPPPGPTPGFGVGFNASTVPTGFFTQRLVAGFWNAGTALDLAGTNNGVDLVVVMLGNGAGGFATSTTGATAVGPFGIASGLFNADAIPDLVTANQGGQTVSVLLGNGAGAFAQAGGNFTTGAATDPTGIVAADLDGNGQLDVATANSNGAANNISVLLGNGAGALGAPAGFPSGGLSCQGIAAALLNADGLLDLVVTNALSDNFSRLLGTGGGAFGAGTTFATGAGPRDPLARDLTGDGRVDVVVPSAVGNSLSVYLGDGTGGFTQAPGSPFAVGSAPSVVVSADFNGDGFLDLACNNSGSNTVSLLLGNGAGGFALVSTLATGTFPRCLATGDFNGDGRPDIVAGQNGGLAVFLHQ